MRIDVSAARIPTQGTPAATPALKDDSASFGEQLMDAIQEVSGQQAQARGLQNQMMAGQPVEFHDLMIAMERASVSMALTMQVRNKLLEAYQEITRMQV